MGVTVRGLTRRLYRGLLRARLREWPGEDLGRPAVVFAPHPDDETLGCGGTILRKKRAGAAVRIVFVTDGARSHPALMPPEEMRVTRAAEARAAAAALGVPERDVVLLGLPDGKLSEHEPEAAEKIAGVLRADLPAEVFVPYHKDGPPDHEATTRAVDSALRACGHEAVVYEYPVWFWYHWPWTPPSGRGRALVGELRESARRARRLLRDFRVGVRVGEELGQKRSALARHRSQVERLRPDPSWLTLGDIGGGAFLECFFLGEEVFHRRPGGARGAGV
jgi:LmbE family N-acetylglucosaminyl deacetylase